MNLSELDTYSNNTNIFSNLSELSQSELTQIHQDGGFLDFLCGDSKIDKAVLEAVRLKKYDIVNFFVDKDLVESYNYQDENGNTLLHYLALDYESTRKIIKKLLERSDIRSFINIQNKNGDTPLILAVISSNHDLCEHLISRGADKTIKNKQEYCVDTETATHTQSSHSSSYGDTISIKPLQKDMEIFKHLKANNSKQKNLIFNPVIEFLKNESPNYDHTSEPYTFTAIRASDGQKSNTQTSDVLDTEKFIEEMTRKLNNKDKNQDNITDQLLRKLEQAGGALNDNNSTDFLLNELENKINKTGGSSNIYSDTDKLINTLKNYMKNDDLNQQQGGQRFNEYSETEQLINTLKAHMQQEQDGGAKRKTSKTSKTSKKTNKKTKTVMGKRALARFSEYAVELDNGSGTELARIINNQTSEIIENILKKIQEIITKNKDEFKKVSAEVAKGTEEVARIYKAALWSEVKNNEKNTTKSSLDVAVEVQKIVTKEKLLGVDYKKWKEILEKNREEKEKAMKNRPVNKDSSTQESSTITFSSSDESF